MVDTEPVPLEGWHDALFGRVAPAVAALATGSAFGWFFKLELLRLLVDPWRGSRRIWDGNPSAEHVASWFRLVPATVGLLLALPWLTVLAWSVLAPRSGPISGRSRYGFILWSYAAIGIGLCLTAFVALPAYLVQQRVGWQGIVPAPWAAVEIELGFSVGVALVFQLAALLCAFAGVRLLQRIRASHPT